MKIQRRPARPARGLPPDVTAASTRAPARNRHAQVERTLDGTEPPRPQRGDPATASSGGAPASALLQQRLLDVARGLEALEAAALPTSPQALVNAYSGLGMAAARTEAVLIAALDALDPRTGGGRAQPAAPYEAVRTRCFDLLRRTGALFDALEPAFSSVVHGGKAWPSQPVQVAADRGDGQPLRLYRNTFKKAKVLTEAERRAEYQQRVERFVARGGRFDDIRAATSASMAALPSGVHFDYVMREDGSLRLGRLDQDPKPGHTLLAGAGPAFWDRPVRAAGELWVLKDSAGDVEAVIVANNSGHYKPAFADLANTLPALEALGIPRERIVLFGGPNNLPSMFEEMAGKFTGLDLSHALPPDPASLRSELARAFDPLSLRLPGGGV